MTFSALVSRPAHRRDAGVDDGDGHVVAGDPLRARRPGCPRLRVSEYIDETSRAADQVPTALVEASSWRAVTSPHSVLTIGVALRLVCRGAARLSVLRRSRHPPVRPC